jgi:hypothetical protein
MGSDVTGTPTVGEDGEDGVPAVGGVPFEGGGCGVDPGGAVVDVVEVVLVVEVVVVVSSGTHPGPGTFTVTVPRFVLIWIVELGGSVAGPL